VSARGASGLAVLILAAAACGKGATASGEPVAAADVALEAASPGDARDTTDARDAAPDLAPDAAGERAADASDAADALPAVDAHDAPVTADAPGASDAADATDASGAADVTAPADAASDQAEAGDACADCWKQGVFGPPSGWPRTVQLAATTRVTDYRCVVVFGTTGCLAQNDPPCINAAETRTATLSLSIQADGSTTVQAPYQDMCTADYVGGVIDTSGNPTGEPVPTSYAVPLATRTWLFAPRSIDHCRVDLSGNDAPVTHQASTVVEAADILITQDCFTTLRDDTNGPQLLHDTRHYVTTLALP
jgi:hypothetical protein